MQSIVAEKYQLTSELGRGGMGMVYKATHISLGRVDALKVLHPALSGDQAFLARFSREAQAMARLDHLNIVRVYDSFEFEGKYFISMEYFEGNSLASIISSKKELRISQVLSIISQATSGLAYAHARGVIHRDIKPENMMINSNFRLKLTDFGIAAAKNETNITNSGDVIGSPHYMSPEQARGTEIDNRSDLYSLGMVFYELITGSTPFQGESGVNIIKKLALQETDLPLEFDCSVPHKVQQMITSLMHLDPDKRYQNAAALQHAIADAMGSEKSQQARRAADQVDSDMPTTVTKPAKSNAATPQPYHSTPVTGSLLLVLFLVSGAYVYVNQNTIFPQLAALLDFRPQVDIVQEDARIEVERMHAHLHDHENAANEARKKIDELSLVGEAKTLYEEAVKVQINGVTELTEALGHTSRTEYEESKIVLLIAEAFFEEAENQFLLAYEMAEKSASTAVVESLIDEAILLKQEVGRSEKKARTAKAEKRNLSEFNRGLFYQKKANHLFLKSQHLLKDLLRLKSRASIDDAIIAYTSAEGYFEEARRIAEDLSVIEGVDRGLDKLAKIRLVVTTAKIDAEYLDASSKATNLFEKANALNNELNAQAKDIHKLIGDGQNRRAVNRLEGALKLAAKVEVAYKKAGLASAEGVVKN